MKELRIEKAHPIDLHVGRRVRQRRKALHLTQQEIAKRLGLTFQQVQKYERGSNRISASKLYEIAEVLRTPISWFFEGTAAPDAPLAAGPGAMVQAFLATGEAIDLGEAYLAIPSGEQRRCMLDLIRVMGGEAYG